MAVSGLVGKGLYSAREAARLTGVPVTNLRRWIFGYQSKGKSYEGLWERTVDESDTIGFHDLLELKLVYAFRKHGLSIPVIREAARIARDEFGEYPFSRQQFHTDGEALFVEAANNVDDLRLIDIIKKQYVVDQVYRPSFLESVDFSESGGAERWYPVHNEEPEKGKVIVLDPQRSFGKPILKDSGVPTRILYEAYRFNDPVDIAANYNISVQDVEQAVLYETRLQAAA